MTIEELAKIDPRCQPQRSRLHEYQERCIAWMKERDRGILSVGMGLGKTAAVLHYLSDTNPNTVLIVAPKRVAETVWVQEAEKWGLLHIRDKMTIVKGSPSKRRDALNDTKHPWKVIGRDNIDDIALDMKWDVCVLDELTSFKNITAKRTQQMCAITRCCCSEVWGLTGTFLANGAIDIYGQCSAVGFYDYPCEDKAFFRWRATWFKDILAGSGLAFPKWRAVAPLTDILAKVKDDIFTLSSDDYLDIPPVTFHDHAVELGKEERKAYDDLNAFLCCTIDGDTETVGENAKFAKLQTMCDGFLYTGDAETAQGDGFWQCCTRQKQSSKLEAVADFCASAMAEGESMLLFYAFRAEENWLIELFDKRAVPHDSVRNADALANWSAGKWKGVLMAHPASAGHGLNLQHGGHILVWSTLTYNFELYAQANARLARQGQTMPVQVHVFAAKDTVEQGKAAALRRKAMEQNEFINLTRQ